MPEAWWTTMAGTDTSPRQPRAMNGGAYPLCLFIGSFASVGAGTFVIDVSVEPASIARFVIVSSIANGVGSRRGVGAP